MGEFEFIEDIRQAFEGIGDEAIRGIGDDCAVMPLGDDTSLVMTTDMLAEGVHFLRPATSPRELGGKSLAVNLSDVAAMGARPTASLLSLALPAGCRGEWAREFMEGYREMSARHGVKLAGGDTTASLAGVVVNVTAIGHAPTSRLKYRSGARMGEIIAVNGPLGESAAGLQDILEWIEREGAKGARPPEWLSNPDTGFANIHRNPLPQVDEGQWLGGRGEVGAMIDLSDGLASDLGHILRASGVGARVELTHVPTPVDVELAVTGGEDYKLLLTASPQGWHKLAAEYRDRFGAELHPVGVVTAPAADSLPGQIVWTERGVPVTKNWRGFTHF